MQLKIPKMITPFWHLEHSGMMLLKTGFQLLPIAGNDLWESYFAPHLHVFFFFSPFQQTYFLVMHVDNTEGQAKTNLLTPPSCLVITCKQFTRRFLWCTFLQNPRFLTKHLIGFIIKLNLQKHKGFYHTDMVKSRGVKLN